MDHKTEAFFDKIIADERRVKKKGERNMKQGENFSFFSPTLSIKSLSILEAKFPANDLILFIFSLLFLTSKLECLVQFIFIK